MKRILAASAFVLASQMAFADNWTGAYGGINLGYAWGDADVSYDDFGGDAFFFGSVCDFGTTSKDVVSACVARQDAGVQSLVDGVPIGSADADGVMLGATFGINQQFGHWVVGIEGDVMNLGLSETYTGSTQIIGPSPNALGEVNAASVTLPSSVELNIDGGLGIFASLRVGYSFNDDHTLIYGKAGYGGADLGITVGRDCLTTSICGATWADNFTEAFVFGAGVEHMITKTMSVKIEYLRMEFDDTLAIAPNPFDPGYDAYEFDVSADTVRVGLNFQIGSPF